MPGDLWTGYLKAQAADVAEQEREEGKKKERLEGQLQKLKMEGLRRTIDRDAQKWEIEQGARAQREEMLSGLRDFFGDETIDAFELEFDLSGLRPKKEQEPWFIGTPHEERGLGKEFHIKPGGSTRSVTDAERAERYSKIPEEQRTEYQKKFLKKYFEGTRGGGTGDWLDDLLAGEEGGEPGGEDLDAQILETQKEIRELLKGLK